MKGLSSRLRSHEVSSFGLSAIMGQDDDDELREVRLFLHEKCCKENAHLQGKKFARRNYGCLAQKSVGFAVSSFELLRQAFRTPLLSSWWTHFVQEPRSWTLLCLSPLLLRSSILNFIHEMCILFRNRKRGGRGSSAVRWHFGIKSRQLRSNGSDGDKPVSGEDSSWAAGNLLNRSRKSKTVQKVLFLEGLISWGMTCLCHSCGAVQDTNRQTHWWQRRNVRRDFAQALQKCRSTTDRVNHEYTSLNCFLYLGRMESIKNEEEKAIKAKPQIERKRGEDFKLRWGTHTHTYCLLYVRRHTHIGTM